MLTLLLFPCLAKGISVDKFVDLALAYSLGAGVETGCLLVSSNGRMVFVRVGLSIVCCPNALAASDACFVFDWWFTPHFSVVARFRLVAWSGVVACPEVYQPVWHACWLDTPDGSSSSPARVVQDVWDVYRDELGMVPAEVVLALRDAVSRSAVDDFWFTWTHNAVAGLFRAYCGAGGPTEADSSAFLGRGLLRIRRRRLGGRAVWPQWG